MQVMSAPPAVPVLLGFLPSAGLVTNANELYVGIGIIGATVMPHNLYLHSALVQSRVLPHGDDDSKREAVRYLTVDTAVALTIALFVNASILIVAAAAFSATGNAGVADLETAYALLAPLLGSTAAPILFAVALLAAGQNSTLTGVMAGQVRGRPKTCGRRCGCGEETRCVACWTLRWHACELSRRRPYRFTVYFTPRRRAVETRCDARPSSPRCRSSCRASLSGV